MNKSIPKTHIGILVMLGAVWGLSEAGLGMGLRSCAASVSGSLMTGVALFFIAAGWMLSRRVFGVVLLVAIAALFKMFDALLLSYPIKHGAIANPIFAFIMEAAAFIVLISLIKNRLSQKPTGQALLGGMTALLAANLFPLVKYATGIPACVMAGTGYPLSLYYVHFAILVSIVTVPLGFWVGAKAEVFSSQFVSNHSRMNYIYSPAALLICLLIIVIIRLA